jgi:hypothetical protein
MRLLFRPLDALADSSARIVTTRRPMNGATRHALTGLVGGGARSIIGMRLEFGILI